MLSDLREGDEALEDYSDAAATFGDRLGHAREAIGLSQAELARRIGVKLATLRTWEDDRAEPRANRLQMLAGLLSVPMVWLMSGLGEGPSLVASGRGAAARRNDAAGCLGELRDLRAEQARIVNRLARLEKRLRAVLETHG
jgi:transcriptional regulator with XRE-family HTH domain